MLSTNARTLGKVARRLGFAVNAKETKLYQEAIKTLVNEMADFLDSPEDRPPLHKGFRDPGSRPTAEEDPYNCFITRCLVKGSKTGPLSRRRVGLKDNVSVAKVPLTLGSHFMKGFLPDFDATVVTRFLSAGADIVGKTNMDDFSRAGYGFGTGLGDYGRCLNPHNPDHVTGGSSSGSAAGIASGALDLAIGGDQGGSIRIPAAWCGVVGLKSTFGMVPFTGAVGIEPSLDNIGPMGQTVKDVAVALECIAGPDGYDSRQVNIPSGLRFTEGIAKGVKGIRIGILREGFGGDGAEPDVDEAVLGAVDVLQRAGAEIHGIKVPVHLACTSLIPALSIVGIDLLTQTFGGALLQGYCDTHLAEAFGRFLKKRPNSLPPAIKLCIFFSAYQRRKVINYYGRAQNVRGFFRRAYDEAFRKVDCLVMPTVPVKAPRYIAPEDDEDMLRRALLRTRLRLFTRNTAPFNVTGHPALSVPCGLSQGLPIGMMLVGPHLSDGMLLRIAHAYEQSAQPIPPAPRKPAREKRSQGSLGTRGERNRVQKASHK